VEKIEKIISALDDATYGVYRKGYQDALREVLRYLRDRNFTFGSSATSAEEWAVELEHLFLDCLTNQ
jgi:hypothetical protein